MIRTKINLNQISKNFNMNFYLILIKMGRKSNDMHCDGIYIYYKPCKIKLIEYEIESVIKIVMSSVKYIFRH